VQEPLVASIGTLRCSMFPATRSSGASEAKGTELMQVGTLFLSDEGSTLRLGGTGGLQSARPPLDDITLGIVLPPAQAVGTRQTLEATVLLQVGKRQPIQWDALQVRKRVFVVLGCLAGQLDTPPQTERDVKWPIGNKAQPASVNWAIPSDTPRDGWMPATMAAGLRALLASLMGDDDSEDPLMLRSGPLHGDENWGRWFHRHHLHPFTLLARGVALQWISRPPNSLRTDPIAARSSKGRAAARLSHFKLDAEIAGIAATLFRRGKRRAEECGGASICPHNRIRGSRCCRS
jgi:hypothetical protein